MRQVLGAGALGRPRGKGWGERWEGGSGWGTHVNPWLIHVNVWQKPLQYCKVISLQLIKIKGEKRKENAFCRGFLGGSVVKNLLSVQDSQAQSLVWDDHPCLGATKAMRHSYCASAVTKHALRNKRSHHKEKPAGATKE